MSSLNTLLTDRYRKAGLLAVVGAGLLALVASLLTGAIHMSPASAQDESDFTLDGNIDEAAYGSFGSLTYTTDAGETIPNGLISVAETDEAYWVAFQQSLRAKSNAYCENDGDHEDCYQKFDSLVGSDYISFFWDASLTGTQDLYVPVDILSEDKDAGGYVGGVGTGDGGEIEYGDDKAKDNPALADAVRGFSSLHYNWNTIGWQNEANSPNFTPEDDGEGYVYASIAEVRLDKQGLGLADGLADALSSSSLEVETHNSPNAPFADEPRQFIICATTDTQEVDVGQTATFTFEATEDGQPTQGLSVLVLLDGPGEVVSVGGDAGNVGTTGSDGRVDAVVRATEAGETEVRGVIDSDGDGTYDEGTEPITSPPCRLVAGEAPPPGDLAVAVDKRVDADGDGTFDPDLEFADAQGDDVAFRVVVTNTGEVAVVIDSLMDDFSHPDQGAFLADLLSDAGFVSNDCDDLDGVVLEPGESTAPCFFTLADYAPPAGPAEKPDTVTVEVHDEDNPDRTATASDDAAVRTPEPGEIVVTVIKNNDANEDGTFSDVETANDVDQTVDFEVTVRNDSDTSIVVRSLTDEFPPDSGNVIDLFDHGTCDTLENVVLAAGASETCVFSLTDYAPGDADLVDVVTVDVEEEDNPDNVARDRDDSTVRPPTDVGADIDERPEVEPERHPRTGLDATGLAAVALAMTAAGGALVAGSRRRWSVKG